MLPRLTWNSLLAQAGFEREILLPQSPECWDYRHAPLCPGLKVILQNILVSLHFECCLLYEVRCEIFYLWSHIVIQKVSDFGAFQIP
jgi:hypothetical protein